jgi:DNA-binding response OmpR family regulator
VDRLQLGVLDRNPAFGALLAGFLSDHGIAADLHAEADPLLEGLGRNPPNLLLLLEKDGVRALPTVHRIRTVSRIPCIVVGAADDPEGGIGLLDAGADDLMSPGTPMPTMLARMRAVLRRGAWGPANQAPPNGEVDGAWRLLRPRRELRRPGGSDCRLTTAEFDLFCLLVDRSPVSVAREDICRIVFRRRWRAEDRTVDNLVVRLRRKLGDETRFAIRTVQGQGYAFLGFPNDELRED